ncbi:MAG: E3 ubiquitin protein ligase [Candidatus Heimdallarchaeota archaeon]|nr:MAG: E3 ubiquitin protein ligase [Candidatus Heimdallarchaeota archaeon]
MSNSMVKLSHLSRNKTTGNVIILIVIFLSLTFFLGLIGNIFSSKVVELIIGTFLLGIVLSYIVDKRLRQPFFIEISHYQEELNNRQIDLQEATHQIELIEPLQTLTTLKTVLKQMDNLHIGIEEIYNVTLNEISLNFPPIRTSQIQKRLKEIITLVEQFREEMEKKRNKLLDYAQVRRLILTSIDQQLTRPRNEIDVDYLFYKLQKNGNPEVNDDLVRQILDHSLDQGEIEGRLDHKEGGKYLTVENYVKTDREEFRKQCVICRTPIKSRSSSATCPYCENIFHRNHLLEWLKVFNQCPMCHQRLTLFSNR